MIKYYKYGSQEPKGTTQNTTTTCQLPDIAVFVSSVSE